MNSELRVDLENLEARTTNVTALAREVFRERRAIPPVDPADIEDVMLAVLDFARRCLEDGYETEAASITERMSAMLDQYEGQFAEPGGRA